MAQGLSISRLIAAGTTNATLVKATPGMILAWKIGNVAAYPVFVKLYDSATIPTAGAGTPKITLTIPTGASTSMYLGDEQTGGGIYFASGIGFTVTKLMPDADATVLVAGDASINLFYK